MAPHSSTLAWKIPWIKEPGRLQSMGSLRVGQDWATSLSCTGEGNGNPFQCSCLENPRDGGAWWAAVYGVAQSWTRLKWLSSLAAAAWVPNNTKERKKQSNICLFAVGTLSSHYCVMFHFFDFTWDWLFYLVFIFYWFSYFINWFILCPLPICLLEYLLCCRSTVSIIYEMY